MSVAPSYILALDTAMAGCSVAVLDVESGRSEYLCKDMPRGQAEHLIPMVQNCVTKAGVDFQKIDMVAVTIGPGAFTGLRIGLSAARSFGVALRVPVVGVTTFDALAEGFFKDNKLNADEALVVLIETKREDFYWQAFNNKGEPLTEPAAEDAESILNWGQSSGFGIICIGDACERYKSVVGENDFRFINEYILSSPTIIACIALRRSEFGLQQEAEPLYLRGADVSKSKRTQRTIEGYCKLR